MSLESVELFTTHQVSNSSLLIFGSLSFHLQHCSLTYNLGSITHSVAFNLIFNLSDFKSPELQTISATDFMELD